MALPMTDSAAARESMIERQILSRGITDGKILDAFRAVPRELFVAEKYAAEAYGDYPLPIEAEQTISQPYIVAVMIEAAEIGRGDHVLEVGAGSGYAAAVIGRIAERVFAIERHPELVAVARERIQRLGFSNVRIVEGDGSRGWAGEAPYDAILAAASGHHVPQPLVEQLAPRGRLVMPIGEPGAVQRLVKLTRGGDGAMREEDLGPVRFVPLIGEEGWNDA
jgi:protein-L-isoaspartate(D-aspartate) O-methyltransferase